MDCKILNKKGTQMSLTDVRNSIACGGSILWATILGMLGGSHILLSTLLWFIVLDFITGLIASGYRGECFEWNKAVKGIYKKLLYFFIIVAAVQMERALGCPDVGLTTHGKIRLAFLILLNGTEMSSILRNFGLCGITVPGWILQLVQAMKNGKPNGGK